MHTHARTHIHTNTIHDQCWATSTEYRLNLHKQGPGLEYPKTENPRLRVSHIMGAGSAQVNAVSFGSLNPYLRGMTHRQGGLREEMFIM